MKRRLLVYGLLCVCLVWHTGPDSHAAERRIEDLVKVILTPNAFVNQDLVRLGDVCQVTGGSLSLRQRIARLDLIQRPEIDTAENAMEASVTAERVLARILLAGVPARLFSVVGAETTQLSWAEPELVTIGDASVLDALRPLLAEQLSVAESELHLQLVRPLPPHIKTLYAQGQVELRPLPGAQLRTGTNGFKIGVYQGDQLVQTFTASVQVGLFREVLISKRAIRTSEKIDASMVEVARRAVSGRSETDYATDVVGMTPRRPIPSGQIILRSDLQSRSTQKDIVVRARDLVEITARKGPLTVSVAGAEALQQGAIGDTIRVRNPQSNKVITAQVVDQGSVEIRL